MSYTVFFSHNSADKRWIVWMAENARRIGVEPYLYEHDIQPGKVVAAKVKQAIESCDAVIVLISQHSQFAPYVQQEIGFAEAKSKLIVPLVVPGVDPRALAMLDGREYLPFDPSAPEKALRALLTYLNKLKTKKERDQAALLGFGALLLLALAKG